MIIKATYAFTHIVQTAFNTWEVEGLSGSDQQMADPAIPHSEIY